MQAEFSLPPSTAPVRADAAIRGILISNAVAVAVAWWFGDGLGWLMWPYWIQSVVIGFYAQRRIRRLREFSTEGLKINGRPAEPTAATARSSANFFVVHYGFFHFGYALFLTGLRNAAGDAGMALSDLVWIAVAALSFVWTHGASHREHVEADLRGKPNLGTLMFVPYLRILPMHLTIIAGAAIWGGTFALLLFGLLKTGADVVMHVVEHRLLQGKAVTAGGAMDQRSGPV